MEFLRGDFAASRRGFKKNLEKKDPADLPGRDG
jgi:hypothetical protein